jgi:hypothetical protein
MDKNNGRYEGGLGATSQGRRVVDIALADEPS